MLIYFFIFIVSHMFGVFSNTDAVTNIGISGTSQGLALISFNAYRSHDQSWTSSLWVLPLCYEDPRK